jgi:hypothetical protein
MPKIDNSILYRNIEKRYTVSVAIATPIEIWGFRRSLG